MQNNDDILTVTVENYPEVVEKCDKTVLLDIGASWCPDCRRIEPMFKEFANKYRSQLQFATCNFDTESALNDKFGVRHIPTLLLIKGGRVVDTLVEPKNTKLFEEFVLKALHS